MIHKVSLWKRILPVLVILLVFAVGCGKTPENVGNSKVKVVATTSIVADIVRQVGGEYIEVTSLTPVGVDIHEYQPSPQDVARVADADMVFENGLGLEQFIGTLVQNAGGKSVLISVSDGITARQFTAADQVSEETANSSGDPHVWMDPNNVKIWVQNIQKALTEKDPAHQAAYEANAQNVMTSLTDLDSWIQAQVSQIPESERLIVTDHMLFGYFAERYGFKQVGAVIPSYSTEAEPSAQEIAALEDAIRKYGVKVIFVGEYANPTLAQRVADDTRIQLVKIYTGSLSSSDGPAATYQDYIRYNVAAIINGITGSGGTK